jgi:hypothetical protein
MNPLQPDDVLSVPAPDFQPLRLSLDDALPVSMVLLLGYRRRLDPSALRQALQTALRAFPHLGGRLHLELQPLRAALAPGGGEVKLEWVRAGNASFEALETLDQDSLLSFFAPSAAATARSPMQALQAPLLQLRLTWLSEGEACVLGLMASHMALDGSGLALFLEHMTAAMRGGKAPAVIHDRQVTFPHPLPEDRDLPPEYREVPLLSLAMAQDQDPLASARATVFSVPLDSLGRRLGSTSATEARFYLAASLAREVAALQPGRNTLALWCNARGLGHVPRNYTGNAGCYVHLPLEPGDPLLCHNRLKRLITRQGFAEISGTYARLKAAEAAGRLVFWGGPGDHLLSLNLVPHVRGAADFGQGSPGYAQLLTRNVSGLRLFGSPDGSRLVVEAALPSAHGEALLAACDRLGLPAQAWHRPDRRRTPP